MSQDGSLSINSVGQAWLTVTSTKEVLSRSGGQTWRSPLNHNSIRFCQRKGTSDAGLLKAHVCPIDK